MVELVPFPFERRDELRRLLADYLYEFDGRVEPYPYLDAYWQEPERRPYFIADGSAVLGLALIRVRDGGWEIAEFSVVAEARRGGVGRAAVERLATLARAQGATFLQAKVHPDNLQALPFWLACGFAQIESPGVVTTRLAL